MVVVARITHVPGVLAVHIGVAKILIVCVKRNTEDHCASGGAYA